MSSNVLDSVILPEGIVRDFCNTQAGLAAGYVFDIQNTGNALENIPMVIAPPSRPTALYTRERPVMM